MCSFRGLKNYKSEGVGQGNAQDSSRHLDEASTLFMVLTVCALAFSNFRAAGTLFWRVDGRPLGHIYSIKLMP